MKSMMNCSWKRVLLCAAMVTSLCMPQMSRAQDAPPPPPPPPAAVADSAGPSEEPSDPTFDRYVDLKLLGVAWRSRDAGTLADLAFQFAEGERVLRRSHKAIKASAVLDAAIKLAVETSDKETLARLAKAVEQSGDKDRAAQLALAQKAAGTSRAIDPSLTEGTEEAVIAARNIHESISAARLGGRTDDLDALERLLATESKLNEKQKLTLKKLIGEARSGMPEKADQEAAAAMELLQKLGRGSRGLGFGPENFGTWRVSPTGTTYRENFALVWHVIYVWNYQTNSGRLVNVGTPEYAKVMYGYGRGNYRDEWTNGNTVYVDKSNPCNLYVPGGGWTTMEKLLRTSKIRPDGTMFIGTGSGSLIGKGGAGMIGNSSGQIIVYRDGKYIITTNGIVAAGGGN